MAAAAQQQKMKEPTNYVHQNAILCETITKEQRTHKVYTNFTINPFRPMYNITGKPNSTHDAEMEQGEEDEQMRKVIQQAQRAPTQKYTHPQTEAQEIGWITQPLLKKDRSDVRLNHPRKQTDVTKPKEAEWRLKEQTENLN